jgi:hypothetical protein
MYRSFFLTSALVGGEWQLHAPATLPPGKSPRYPFYRRLGGPQSRSGRYGEVKLFFYPIGTRTPAPLGRPARSQSLYRLSYPGSVKGGGIKTRHPLPPLQTFGKNHIWKMKVTYKILITNCIKCLHCPVEISKNDLKWLIHKFTSKFSGCPPSKKIRTKSTGCCLDHKTCSRSVWILQPVTNLVRPFCKLCSFRSHVCSYTPASGWLAAVSESQPVLNEPWEEV